MPIMGPATEAVQAARPTDRAQLVVPSTEYAEVPVYPERAGVEVAAKIRAFCAQEFTIESMTRRSRRRRAAERDTHRFASPTHLSLRPRMPSCGCTAEG